MRVNESIDELVVRSKRLTLVGTESILEALLLKILSVPQGAVVYRTGQLIEPIDLFLYKQISV